LGGESGKEFWRSLVLIVLSCFVQWSLFFDVGVDVVVCAMGVEVKVKVKVTERNRKRVRG
jgi:hypothetical protein